jgi:hypothetical protein
MTPMIMDVVSQALEMMGFGMLGIFAVIGLIAGIVTLLAKLGSKK